MELESKVIDFIGMAFYVKVELLVVLVFIGRFGNCGWALAKGVALKMGCGRTNSLGVGKFSNKVLNCDLSDSQKYTTLAIAGG